MNFFRPFLIFSVALAIYSCSSPTEKTLSVSSLNSPTGTNSLTPHLFTAADGTVYLSWMEKQDSLTYLKFSRLQGDTWSEASTIAKGTNWFVNWADFPSLIVNGDNLSAHWLQKRDKGTYDYDVRIAQSTDGGRTWGDSFIPHKDGIAAEHGFVSMLPLANGQNFATWLDGRNTKGGHKTHDHGHGGAMTLRAGTFDTYGNMLSGLELDARICDCCQTTAALTAQGPIVAYRDRSDIEIRDISITRFVNGDWTKPKAVHNDNWTIEGCPVNGPSLSAIENRVALAWFTAAQGFVEVKLAFSDDAGASFSSPVVLAKGNTNGRVATQILPNGQTAVTWMETEGKTAYIKLALFDAEAEESGRMTIAESRSERASGFPVITSQGNDIIASWTETGTSSQVSVARISFK